LSVLRYIDILIYRHSSSAQQPKYHPLNHQRAIMKPNFSDL